MSADFEAGLAAVKCLLALVRERYMDSRASCVRVTYPDADFWEVRVPGLEHPAAHGDTEVEALVAALEYAPEYAP